MARNDANRASCKRATTIGGQALIEGLMMIGPDKQALAVRRPDGSIEVEFLSKKKALAIEKIPFVRGSVKLFRQMTLGMKALYRSAELAEADSAEESAGEAKQKKSFLDRHPEVFFGLMTVIALALSIGLFILLPNLITDLLRRLLGYRAAELTRSAKVLLTFVEGLVRVVIFLGYLWLTAQNKEVKRVWQYHGSEHKTIACYEAGEALTVDNIKRFSRFHPRCGTSFIFLVLIISVIVFSFAGWHNPLINVALRLLLLPLIAGLSYEIIRWAGVSESALARFISSPGLWLQRLTTAEPDEAILEVAIQAMEAVLPEDPNSDLWSPKAVKA
ncbi:MAG: DUF1385 domain-containing protein [Eubacteriales bacterium]|nr:DUF1385 domain-containing protein [Eubacteriales bacterium]